MLRKIVKIDADKCNGCGQCVTACVEGAIQLVNGKAQLVMDSYCDGLGACLGHCPMDAITIEEREAPAFDEKAAMAHAATGSMSVTHHSEPCEGLNEPSQGCVPVTAEGGCATPAQHHHAGHACPGSMARSIKRPASPAAAPVGKAQSELTHWPVQLKLIATNAPALQGADLLLAADCVPFALADFHSRLLRGKALLVGCPKLDDAQYYVEKLTEILKQSDIRSITVAHMEVPCCSGLSRITQQALALSGKDIPVRDVTISIEGKVLREE